MHVLALSQFQKMYLFCLALASIAWELPSICERLLLRPEYKHASITHSSFQRPSLESSTGFTRPGCILVDSLCSSRKYTSYKLAPREKVRYFGYAMHNACRRKKKYATGPFSLLYRRHSPHSTYYVWDA
jgi:hypothetical protein